MVPDRTIVHLFKRKIPDPLPLSRVMACTKLQKCFFGYCFSTIYENEGAIFFSRTFE
jgi:hypothetical protein